MLSLDSGLIDPGWWRCFTVFGNVDDEECIFGELAADDVADLLFEGLACLVEDAGFADGLAGEPGQLAQGVFPLFFGDFVPEAVFVFEDGNVFLLE